MKKQNKFVYLFVVQGFYGYGWEDLTTSENYAEARNSLKDYRNNEPGPHRLIKRRELNQQAT